MARLTVDLQGIESVQGRLGSLVRAGQDPTPLMELIGNDLQRSTRERFVTQEDPEGRPWAPLSETTKARKTKNVDKILTQDGHLQQVVVQADRQSVEVGSPWIYAGTQHFGAKKGSFGRTKRGSPIPWGDIPAREFLGLSDDDREEILDTVSKYLADALDGS